ncbi:hypothetical protein Tco_0984566 [Tanacetum coccineum]
MIREYMQTLAPQLKVESNVIDTISLVLNHEQKMNSKAKNQVLFPHNDDCLESKVMRKCCFVVEIDAWLRAICELMGEMGSGGCEITCGDVGVSLMFDFFLQMGFTLILATLDGLDVGLLEDVISGDDCDDDE